MTLVNYTVKPVVWTVEFIVWKYFSIYLNTIYILLHDTAQEVGSTKVTVNTVNYMHGTVTHWKTFRIKGNPPPLPPFKKVKKWSDMKTSSQIKSFIWGLWLCFFFYRFQTLIWKFYKQRLLHGSFHCIIFAVCTVDGA